jgi:glycosyltransferase involved in cell wall biosynthesis
MNVPLISIITPCLNRAEFIPEAVESVLAQNEQNVEHIIMDGGSTDRTLEILERYPHLQIHSGRDRGMYDALNRGLGLARGEIIGFLNSDDLYAEKALAAVREKMQNQNVLAVAGGALVFEASDTGKKEIVRTYAPQGNKVLESVTIGDPYFNAWFFRRSVFEKLHKFDTAYQIVADREFMLKFALSEMPYTTTSQTLYQYRRHPDSLTFDLTYQKLQRIYDEHLLMSSTYLQDQSVPAHAKELIRKLRTRETADFAVRSLRTIHFSNMFHYARRGLEHDPFWMLSFFRRLLHLNK